MTFPAYNFQHFNVDRVSIKFNEKQYPVVPYTPNWDDEIFTREYRDFIDNIGIGQDDVGNSITIQQWGFGSTLWAFDFSPELCNLYHMVS